MNVPSGYTALGLIGFTDQGVYNSATAYVRNDIVHYNGNLWRCLVDDTTAVTPAEGANWTVYLAEPTSAAEDIIAPVEATAISTRIYVEGDQLILADVLYNVTQAIGIGDALAVGTNIAAADTIVEQIAEKANSADLANVATSGNYSDLNGRPSLGTAAAQNIPASGDASTTEVVMGNDTRLSNARNAADVSAWAKAANKPTYNGSEISTSAAKTGTAQQSISNTVASGTSMDNVVGTMLDNDKTLDTNITSLKETLTNNGAHNLFPLVMSDLIETNKGGTWSGDAYTLGGITYTMQKDNFGNITGIKANGTATGSRSEFLFPLEGFDPSGMLLSGCPQGGSSSTYRMIIQLVGEPYTSYAVDTGSGATVSEIPQGTKIRGIFRINSGVTVSNITFKPMLRLASDPDGTFVPYAMTNKQLTDVAEQVKGGYIEEKVWQTLSVTADGSKTYQTLFNELKTAFNSLVADVDSTHLIKVTFFGIDGAYYVPDSTTGVIYFKPSSTQTAMSFTRAIVGLNDSIMVGYRISIGNNLTNCKYREFQVNLQSPNTFTDRTLTVSTANTKLSIIYNVLKKVV